MTLNGQDITKIDSPRLPAWGWAGHSRISACSSGGLTVEENVMCAFDPGKAGIPFWAAFVPTPRRRAEEKRGPRAVQKISEIVGMADFLNERPENLSYGMQRRIEIARALMCGTKVLLLDEPAAGLNPTEVSDWTELIQRISKGDRFWYPADRTPPGAGS